MALTNERRMGMKKSSWMTVNTVVERLGLLLVFSHICRAQDPLNDVHVNPPAPAPTAPIDPNAANPANPPTPPTVTHPALEGKKALSARPNERMRVDVNLVLVPVTVTDPLNRLVTGLERQDFFVYENNALQKTQELLFGGCAGLDRDHFRP